MSTTLTADLDQLLEDPTALDAEMGIEQLDDLVDPDFWDGFVVGAGLGTAVATGAIAIGIAT